MAATFKGGYHVDDHKSLTNAKPTVLLDGSDVHIFPLRQHIGAPLTPCVTVGDYVYVGQKLADSDQFVSAPVHSSVSGTVIDIKQHIHDSGTMIASVFVENDRKYEVYKGCVPHDYRNMSKENVLELIHDAGIVGMGGAGFPTHVKLQPNTKVTHVLINGAECEPYITSDHRYMLEEPEKIIYGLKVCMYVLGLSDGYIGIETNKQDGMESLKNSSEFNEHIHIVPLKTKYPQGAEKQLIKAITGRNVPAGKLPADAGCVVINATTAVMISELFKTGIPPVIKNVTVSGDAIKNPSNFKVRIGTPVKVLIEKAGGFVSEPQKIISGGPMMGITQYNIDYPVTKTTSSVLAMIKAPKTYDEDAPCIRCGRCVSHCPMHLMPYKIADCSKKGDVDTAKDYNALECIECGLCSYICPANKNLLQFIRMIKPDVMKKVRGEAQKNGK